MEIITYTSPIDQQLIHASYFQVANAKGLVVIFHGMAEHRHRYHGFVDALNNQGYACLTMDHRGHGDSFYQGNLKGYFADKDGWFVNLTDLHHIINQIKEKYQHNSIVLFAHSMGSLVALSYVKQYGNHLSGLILSGIPQAPVGLPLVKALVYLYSLVKPQAESNLLYALTFEAFEKKDKSKVQHEWLSYNQDNVLAYTNDDKCGFKFTKKAAYDLMTGLSDAYSVDRSALRLDFSVYMIKGKDDVTTSLKTYQLVSKKLKVLGINDIEIVEVEKMKHECLFEKNNVTLSLTITDWLK